MSDVILYTTDDGKTKIDLRLQDGTAWLSQQQIADLFQTTKQNISKHIKAIYEDEELDEAATVNQQLTVQKEGAREVSRSITLYIYLRVDSDKPFAGLSNFKGGQPTQTEAMVAKNYLSEQELKVLNNLVSAYFDLAELNAIEQREMRMVDYVRELDTILGSAGRKLLDNAGSISHAQAETKAKAEYQKYKSKTLANVEKDYLNTISALEKQAKKESRKK